MSEKKASVALTAAEALAVVLAIDHLLLHPSCYDKARLTPDSAVDDVNLLGLSNRFRLAVVEAEAT